MLAMRAARVSRRSRTGTVEAVGSGRSLASGSSRGRARAACTCCASSCRLACARWARRSVATPLWYARVAVAPAASATSGSQSWRSAALSNLRSMVAALAPLRFVLGNSSALRARRIGVAPAVTPAVARSVPPVTSASRCGRLSAARCWSARAALRVALRTASCGIQSGCIHSGWFPPTPLLLAAAASLSRARCSPRADCKRTARSAAPIASATRASLPSTVVMSSGTSACPRRLKSPPRPPRRAPRPSAPPPPPTAAGSVSTRTCRPANPRTAAPPSTACAA